MRISNYLLPLGIATLLICASPGSSAYAATAEMPTKQAFLTALCDPGRIENGVCNSSKSIEENCDIVVGKVGKIIVGGKSIFWASAGSEKCAETGGRQLSGTVLELRDHGGNLKFHDFLEWVDLSEGGSCGIFSLDIHNQNAYCTSHAGNEGYDEQSLEMVISSADIPFVPKDEFGNNIEAVDTTGAFGEQQINCNEPQQKGRTYFLLGHPKPGRAHTTVVFDVVYADETQLGLLCGAGHERVIETRGEERILTPRASVPSAELKEGCFVYNMELGTFLFSDKKCP